MVVKFRKYVKWTDFLKFKNENFTIYAKNATFLCKHRVNFEDFGGKIHMKCFWKFLEEKSFDFVDATKM